MILIAIDSNTVDLWPQQRDFETISLKSRLIFVLKLDLNVLFRPQILLMVFKLYLITLRLNIDYRWVRHEGENRKSAETFFEGESSQAHNDCSIRYLKQVSEV